MKAKHTKPGGMWRLFAAALSLVAVIFVCGCGTSQASGDQGAAQSSSSSSSDAASYTTVQDGKLTVVSDMANPPFDYYQDGTTTPQGFEVELMQALADKLGLQCEYLTAQKFDSIIPMIQEGGRADVGASNFTITDERKQQIDFTDPYLDSNQGLVVKADQADAVKADPSYSSLNVSSAQIAVQAGTTGESWARENLPNATIVALDDPIQSLTGVSTGLYAAAVADLPVMQYETINSYTDLAVAAEIPTGEQYGLVVSKDNPGLTAALNQALAEITSDGTLGQLEQKWFGEDMTQQASAAAATTDASASTDSSAAASGDDGTVTPSKATARPNESGGDGVIGGENTRLTYEANCDVASGVSSITLSLPDDATFDGSTTKVTVLDGLNRISIDSTTQASGNTLTVDFATPIPSGSLLRLEVTDMKFPSAGGDYAVSASYTSASGAQGTVDDSNAISIIANTPVQRIVTWLDDQPAVEAWNSVPFLGMFFRPQLLVTSFVSLFGGWLVCLAIVLIAYPFAIILGLLFSMLRISKYTVARGVASVYINILRGTPLFLQIYIMFFGLPMVGINIDNNVLGVIVMAINSSAYLAEIFRAGIQSIPQGQYEAASSLGMTGMQTMFYVILPQTIRRVLPTVTSDFITSYKDTSLLSSVGVMELMMFSKNLTTTSGNITPYMAAAIYYLIVTLPLIKVVGIIERHLANEEHGGGARPKGDRAAAGEKAEQSSSARGVEMAVHAEAADEPDGVRSRSAADGPSAFDALFAPFRSHLGDSEA